MRAINRGADDVYIGEDPYVTLHGESLLASPLDTQIRRAGGRGFNCDVKLVQAQPSSMYEFDTDEGVKRLLLPAERDVATISGFQHRITLLEGKLNVYINRQAHCLAHIIRFDFGKFVFSLRDVYSKLEQLLGEKVDVYWDIPVSSPDLGECSHHGFDFCSSCLGSGINSDEEICYNCGGGGVVKEKTN